jgi:hypothetical protein
LFVPQTFDLTRFFFFSASSFYPGRRAGTESSTFTRDSYHLTDSNNGDTDIECADDWLAEPEPELEQLATKISSKASEAMAIEVSIPSPHFISLSLQILCSGQLGMSLSPYLTW